jgi:putative transposase
LKLTVPIRLVTDPTQSKILHDTILEANRVSNLVASMAWEQQTLGKIALQKLVYHQLRDQTTLSSQMLIHAIHKVADAYRINKKVIPEFRPTGAIAYDARILTLRNEKQFITIWTTLGRIKISYTSGERQLQQLHDATKVGECDLIFRNNQWYLHCSVEIPEKRLQKPQGILGVDLGIKNIAVTSDNEVHCGAHLNSLRKRHNRLRAKLQRKGTRSAKRLLRKRSRRERRMARNVNHIISKRIVATAKRTKRSIALEDLKGIRKRTTRTRVKVTADAATQPQRATLTLPKKMRQALSSWSFYQLRTFIEYKARLAGVEVVLVNPKNTSITCPECGLVRKSNRRDRDHFGCRRKATSEWIDHEGCRRKGCGYADHSDYVAAVNIAQKANLTTAVAVNQPNGALKCSNASAG